MPFKKLSIIKHLFVASVLMTQLSGCAVAVVAGAASAASAAGDRRSVGAQIDDNTIELSAAKRLGNTSDLKQSTNISSVSVNGQLLLVGQASSDDLIEVAINTVKDIQGVKKVHNQIRIGTPTSVSTRTNDVWITSKVKTQFLTDKRVTGHSIKVVTENSEVFLMGIVTKEEGDIAAKLASETGGVEKVIQIFEYL